MPLAHEAYSLSEMEPLFSVVRSKGRIVIPVALRDKLGLKVGTQVAFQQEDDHLILQPITREFIHSLVGCLKGKDSLVAAREHEHRIEKGRTHGDRGLQPRR